MLKNRSKLCENKWLKWGGIILDKIIDDIVSVDLECSKRVEEAKKKKQDVQANMNAKKKKSMILLSKNIKWKLMLIKKN